MCWDGRFFLQSNKPQTLHGTAMDCHICRSGQGWCQGVNVGIYGIHGVSGNYGWSGKEGFWVKPTAYNISCHVRSSELLLMETFLNRSCPPNVGQTNLDESCRSEQPMMKTHTHTPPRQSSATRRSRHDLSTPGSSALTQAAEFHHPTHLESTHSYLYNKWVQVSTL